jgi:hypothetical protein
MPDDQLDRLTLLATYRPVATSADSPLDFYQKVRNQGVSKVTAFVLLREFYGLSLRDCSAVASQAGASPS